MADVTMKDFLLQYFMQLRFDEMPTEVRAQYDEYSATDNFHSDSNMKMWKDKLEGKPMPDPKGTEFHLTDDEWKKIYEEFRRAFLEMHNNRDDLDEKAVEVLDNYFGENKLFSSATATPEESAKILELKSLLETHDLSTQLKEQEILNDDFTYKNLLDGLTSRKYNTDPTFQSKLKQVASYLTMATDETGYYFDEKLLKLVLNNQPADFKLLENAFEKPEINDAKMETFKGRGSTHGDFDILLRELSSNKKFRDAFPSSKIKEPFEKAKEKVAYDNADSKDYVPPKHKEKVSAWKKISSMVGKTYSDVFKKYVKFTGDRLMFSPQAKDIINAIHKEKIKPTEGLEAVLKKEKEIIDALKYKSPKASEHFEWFVSTMKELKDIRPEAYKGALKDGSKMRRLVEEIIIKAAREGKKEEAKTVLETLSVIKYGFTTSKIMETIGKEEVSIFSDPNLSWNKNDSVKLVTAAMDKTIKYAFKGLGYGIATIGNIYKLNKTKFKGKSKRLDEERAAMAIKDDEEKQIKEGALDNLRAEAVTPTTELDNLDRTWNINDSTIARRETELQRDRTRETAQRTDRDNAKNRLDAAQQKVDAFNQLRTDISNLTAEITAIKNEIQSMETGDINKLKTELAAIPTPYPNAAIEHEARTKQQKLAELTQQVEEKKEELKEKEEEKKEKQTERGRTQSAAYYARSRIPQLTRELGLKDATLSSTKDINDRQQERINRFKDAKASLTELNNQITEHENELANWDANHKDKHIEDYKELMSYWDLLETGRGTHMGKMYNWGRLGFSAENAQKKFDVKKPTIIANHLAGYSYAA